MNKILAAIAVVTTVVASAGSPASAQMTEEAARAGLAPFYKALNAAIIQERSGTHQAVDHAAMGDLPGQRPLQYPRRGHGRDRLASQEPFRI